MPILKHLFLVVGLLGMMIGAAPAGFDEGMAAAARGDYLAAYEIWRPLAEQGDVRAQYNLGVLYDNGNGVPQDFAESATWYRKAGEQGHVDAQAVLGYAYQEGRGVPQDYELAAVWYKRAAARGDIQAQINLGVFYANGQGVERDDVLAHMWLNLAASKLKRGVLRHNLILRRDRIAERLTAEELAKSQRMAREWRPEQ